MAIVYKHIRLDTKEVFYIGIGTKKRRAYSQYKRSKHWHSVVKKSGHTVELLHEDIDWDTACEIEKELIKLYGRKDLGLGTLVNMTDGGDGRFGAKASDETKKKMSLAKKGKKLTQEHIDKTRRWGQKNSDYQNFLDFPILVKNKYKLHKYLIENGIETKLFHYKDCRNIFIKNKYEKKLYEEEIICLPNHTKITKTYINLIINKIVSFYKK